MANRLRIITYNSTGLAAHRISYIRHIIDKCQPDLLFLQETWLLPRDVSPVLSNIHDDYLCTGVSGMPSNVVLQGRPYGGLGILWKKSLAAKVKVITTNHNRLCAVTLQLANRESLLLLNCYMPTDTRSTVMVSPDFELCVNTLDEIIQTCDADHIIVGGDINVDLRRNSSNLGHMLQFACNNNLCFLWDHQLSPDDYTFSSSAMSNGSRIDHFLVTTWINSNVIASFIEDIPMEHGHRPLGMDIGVPCPDVPGSHDRSYKPVVNIAWSKVTDNDLANYHMDIDHGLTKISMLRDNETIRCEEVGCTNKHHLQIIDCMVQEIVNVCLNSGFKVFPRCCTRNILKPCWTENIAPKRADSLFWGKIWRECGRPRNGVVLDVYTRTKREYHKAVRYHRITAEQNRRTKIAEAIARNDSRSLWTELKKLKPSHKVNPPEIDGYSNANEICELFDNKFKDLYNSVPSLTPEYYALQEQVIHEC